MDTETAKGLYILGAFALVAACAALWNGLDVILNWLDRTRGPREQ